jgi:5-methylcytosine-specific restriction endonuclease McrA
MKICSRCKKEKSESEFEGGCECKPCIEYKKFYYVNNRDKLLGYSKEYYQENKSKVRERFKKNKYKYPKYPKEYNAESRRKSYRKHPETAKAYNHTRRANGGKKLSPDTINKLIEDSGNICFWCDCDIPKGELHIDHIYPVSKGGKNDIFNLVVSCRTCNLRKKDKDPELWLDEVLVKK